MYVQFKFNLFLISEIVYVTSTVLTHGHAGQMPGVPRAKEPHANLCMFCTACLLMFIHWFCTNIMNISLILCNIYIVSSVSGCICTCRGPSVLIFPGVYNAVKTALYVTCIKFNYENVCVLHYHRYPYNQDQMCPSGATFLSADCCFIEVAL